MSYAEPLTSWVSRHLIDFGHFDGGITVNLSYTMLVIIFVIVASKLKTKRKVGPRG